MCARLIYPFVAISGTAQKRQAKQHFGVYEEKSFSNFLRIQMKAVV